MNPNVPEIKLKSVKLLDRNSNKSHRSTTQSHLNGLDVQNRNPAFSNETLLSNVQVEQIQRMINRLDLADLNEPVLKVLGGCNQHAMTMILSLSQDSVQVFDSCHDTHCHFTTISRSFRAWIESSAETFTDFLDASLELVTLEEDDEHGLVDIVALLNSFNQ